MSQYSFKAPCPFINSTKKQTVPVILLQEKKFRGWYSKQKASLKNQINNEGFEGRARQNMLHYDSKGNLCCVIAGIGDPVHIYDLAYVAGHVQKALSDKVLKASVFEFTMISGSDNINKACIGWGLNAYKFDRYKSGKNGTNPVLLWPKDADKNYIEAQLSGVSLTRDLVNMPANDMGPVELEKAAREVAKAHKAKIKVTVDKELLKQNFPLIYVVGDSSPRRPRLIDISWGKASHPKVTIVGKGVCFDTGGNNIKPPRAMLQMKKDMGGAAHALGLATMIMRMKLPICLRVLIPAVENSTSGIAFRPRDVSPSRKGITVELSDTDAEGRLILADALTLACEEKPDLLIDMATLTGAARVGLGYDIPAMFSNNDKLAEELKAVSAKHDDLVWPLPLFDGYRSELDSDVADINNIGTGLAGSIHGGLFLERFLTGKPDWIHLDMYAFENGGKPGRPRGGADTGLRAVYALIAKKFG